MTSDQLEQVREVFLEVCEADPQVRDRLLKERCAGNEEVLRRVRDLLEVERKHALDGLPNRGLSGDGVHPSWPPAGYADSANFANPEALQAGHVARNLKALEVLAHVLGVIGG